MSVLNQWTKILPATASMVVVGGWVTPAQAFFPSYLPDLMNQPVSVVPVPIDPPANVFVPPLIPIPPVSPPPFIPVIPPVVVPPPPTVNPPTEIPVPPTCTCPQPNPPQETPEPATLVAGLIGLGVAGAAKGVRRRFGRARG